MFALELASIACLWQLVRIALPEVSWFQASTAQLAGNAISKCVPGGGPVGAATQMRMLSVSGIDLPLAVSAMGATGLLSTWVLFALPAVFVIVSLVQLPHTPGHGPRGLGWHGRVRVRILAELAVTRSDWLLRPEWPWIERANRSIMRRTWVAAAASPSPIWRRRRDEIVRTLGGGLPPRRCSWQMAQLVADYLVLVAALLAIGSRAS